MTHSYPNEALFRQIQDDMVFGHGCTRGNMFSLLAIKTEGKVFAALWVTGEMVFKLQGESHAHALGLEGSTLFQPMPDRSPLKEWVQVPLPHADLWPTFTLSAMTYVQALSKTPKKKK